MLRLSDLALAGKRKAQSEQSVIVLKLLACPIPHADQSRSHCLTQVVEEDAIDDWHFAVLEGCESNEA